MDYNLLFSYRSVLYKFLFVENHDNNVYVMCAKVMLKAFFTKFRSKSMIFTYYIFIFLALIKLNRPPAT